MTKVDLKKKFKEADIDAVLYPYKKVLSDWREFYSKEEEYETRRQTKELSEQLGERYRKYLQSKNKKIVNIVINMNEWKIGRFQNDLKNLSMKK